MLVGKFEELVVVLLIVLVLFGGKKVPQLARAIGQSTREIRDGFKSGGESAAKKDSTDNAA